jgi:drug/metabolite transporter (DMT)-like permease
LNGSVTWRQQALGVIFVNLATLCWATNAVLGRWLRDDIGPLALSTLRFSVATAFFGILLRGRPAQERRYGMVFYNTLPLYGAVLGAALLGEPLGMIHFVFGGLIIAGGLWATLGRASRNV